MWGCLSEMTGTPRPNKQQREKEKDMKLICSDAECRKENGSGAVFNVTISVDGDRELTEKLNNIEAGYFECCHCHSEAVDDNS